MDRLHPGQFSSYDTIVEEVHQHEMQPIMYSFFDDESENLQNWVQQHEMSYLNEESTPRFYTTMFLGTASLPQAIAYEQLRLSSPPLSQDMSSSSSTNSPPAEPECYPEHYEFDHARAHYAQPAYTSYDNGYIPQASCAQQCIALDQIQDFADAEVANPSHDTIIVDNSFNMRHLHPGNVKQESFAFTQPPEQLQHQHQLASPPASGADQDDVDADGETEDEEEEADEAPFLEYPDPEDPDYNPTKACTRPKRRAARIAQHQTKHKVSSGRVSKSTPPKNKLACKFCPGMPPFPNAPGLAEHMSSSHTRNYTCVFAFAGCPSTFASKNEWKRHTSSQHLNLAEWICTEGSCAKSTFRSRVSPDSEENGSLYNRKDLFTSHLRRMHAPAAVKQGQTSNTWTAKLAQLHTTAKRDRRKPPMKLICTVSGCSTTFTGKTAWEDRMEHVGKHLEKGNVAEHEDPHLIHWAAKEGIIAKSAGNKWKLTQD
ncbi:hypothetical protein BP6252_04514 [Coleophoma cylindrospora]|uniref:C2H2-type domain-containing protein n=1 Tax=Coleophoma cylindrospora TaxID=1849047 RepID=A0A3D8S0T1_9HELO|nr:hypothetical protein BP6252_04514 [Coleophoma cylindrospora]